METIKCNMCGANMIIDEEKGIAVCQYCGTEQPLPEEEIERIEQAHLEKQNQQESIEHAARIKKIRKIAIYFMILMVAVVAALMVLHLINLNNKYKYAQSLLNAGNYIEASNKFEELGGYKDSKDKMHECNYNQASLYMDDKQYIQAAVLFEAADNYKDSKVKMYECKYLQACIYFENKEYKQAEELFIQISSYKDSATQIKECRYLQAGIYLSKKQFAEAEAIYRELSDYKDSADKIKEIKYIKALDYINNKQYGEAHDILLEIRGYKDAEALWQRYLFYDLDYDFVYPFGRYEQDNNTANGKEKIYWDVLKEQNGKVLLASDICIDCKKYNESSKNVTWEYSSLRKWLNNEFLKTAFTAEEQKRIVSVKLANSGNPYYGTNGGNNTSDKVFLLSASDIKYFPESRDVITYASEYSKSKGIYVSGNGDSCWWIRMPGSNGKTAAYVDNSGDIEYMGDVVTSSGYGVRPAIWVKIDPTK